MEVSERSEEYELGTSSGRIWRTFLRYVWLTVLRCRYHCVYLIGRWNGVNGRWCAKVNIGFCNYYVNGSVDWFDYCDNDRMSMTEIDVMVNECKVMRRIQGRRDKMLTWNMPICPRIFKKVEGNKAKAGACVGMWSGGAINYKGGLNVMDFVDDCYLTITYLKTYENLILPMNGMDMWDKSDFPPCLPPSYSKQPGRPRKCRNKEQGEHKGKMKMRASSNQAETALSRIPNTQDSLKCRQCGKKGHNKRTCHMNLPPKAKPATKRKRGTENTQTTIDPSDASTLAGGPSTLKQRSKLSRRVQKGKPLDQML
ncbi:unnamed protein product [Prunus armeniaca]|uniref:CCHC-type domain-containing protein n=1 Tax=Prunus armeniaca TaxID=36596 RepID=A0A6J5X9Z8_PRUAR|nr:unnamed protein product [Prunus armeniaca]